MAARKQKHPIKTRYGVYTCAFEPERDMGGYAVEALDIAGAVSWGKNLAEAKRMIAEAIEGLIETRVIVDAHRAGAVRLIRRTPQLA